MKGRSMSVRIAAPLWARIRDYHCSPGKCREALSYLYGRVEVVDGGLVLLLPEHAPYFAFAEDCFESRSGLHVRLRPEVLNGMLLDFAGSDYNCLINIHDHWFAEDAVF
nr:hypothetical protein [Xanthomonadales bacterium]